MAIKASFSPSSGLLSVFGDNLDNTILVSRDAAGSIFINGGAVPITGGNPTVANTTMIQVFGQGGNDTISLDESNGALPAAQLFGGLLELGTTGSTTIRVCAGTCASSQASVELRVSTRELTRSEWML